MTALLRMPQFDEVWVMPSGDRIDKDMTARDKDRLAMLGLIHAHRFSNDPRLQISDFELKMPRPSQTYQTVEALQATFPDTEFWFAYGPDSYVSMPSWPHGTKLQQTLKVVLFSSGGPAAPAKGTLIRLHISDKFGDISSTKARRLATTGLVPTSMVSEPIARYIAKHNLF